MAQLLPPNLALSARFQLRIPPPLLSFGLISSLAFRFRAFMFLGLICRQQVFLSPIPVCAGVNDFNAVGALPSPGGRWIDLHAAVRACGAHQLYGADDTDGDD